MVYKLDLHSEKYELKKTDILGLSTGVSGHLDSPLGRRKTHVGTPYWMAPEVRTAWCTLRLWLSYLYFIGRCGVGGGGGGGGADGWRGFGEAATLVKFILISECPVTMAKKVSYSALKRGNDFWWGSKGKSRAPIKKPNPRKMYCLQFRTAFSQMCSVLLSSAGLVIPRW